MKSIIEVAAEHKTAVNTANYVHRYYPNSSVDEEGLIIDESVTVENADAFHYEITKNPVGLIVGRCIPYKQLKRRPNEDVATKIHGTEWCSLAANHIQTIMNDPEKAIPLLKKLFSCQSKPNTVAA